MSHSLGDVYILSFSLQTRVRYHRNCSIPQTVSTAAHRVNVSGRATWGSFVDVTVTARRLVGLTSPQSIPPSGLKANFDSSSITTSRQRRGTITYGEHPPPNTADCYNYSIHTAALGRQQTMYAFESSKVRRRPTQRTNALVRVWARAKGLINTVQSLLCEGFCQTESTKKIKQTFSNSNRQTLFVA